MISQADAKYTPKASNPAETCAKCKYFNSEAACDLVGGTIKPGGWCEYFEAIKKTVRNSMSGVRR